MEICSNCRRQIGNLEVAHIFQEHVVCDECNNLLTDQQAKKQINQQTKQRIPQDLPIARSGSSPLVNLAAFVFLAIVALAILVGVIQVSEATKKAKQIDESLRLEIARKSLDTILFPYLDALEPKPYPSFITTTSVTRAEVLAEAKKYVEVCKQYKRTSMGEPWTTPEEFDERLKRAEELVKSGKKRATDIEIYWDTLEFPKH